MVKVWRAKRPQDYSVRPGIPPSGELRKFCLCDRYGCKEF